MKITELLDEGQDLDWGSMSHREFKRRELEAELGHEDEQVRREKRHVQQTEQKVFYFVNVDHVLSKDPNLSSAHLKAKGLRNTTSGKWYLPTTTAREHSTLFRSQLAHIEKEFGKARRWMPTNENATAGATSAANIGTVDNPAISPGKAKGKKSYIGDPWGGKSGTKAPPQPKVNQPKNADGTAKNGVDSNNLFGGGAVKRR